MVPVSNDITDLMQWKKSPMEFSEETQVENEMCKALAILGSVPARKPWHLHLALQSQHCKTYDVPGITKKKKKTMLEITMLIRKSEISIN